jgi:glycosyltransferase involved in cell wall biosynthesis
MAPEFSIIIAVYNDWGPLSHCLESLRQQINAPPFEVIVVDDGSTDAIPEFIRVSNHGYSLTLVQGLLKVLCFYLLMPMANCKRTVSPRCTQRFRDFPSRIAFSCGCVEIAQPWWDERKN